MKLLYLLLGSVCGTVSWLLSIKVTQLINKTLGVTDSDYNLQALVPILAFLLVIGGVSLVPLLFKGYIKDSGVFYKVWSLGFWVGGFVLARAIRGWSKPLF